MAPTKKKAVKKKAVKRKAAPKKKAAAKKKAGPKVVGKKKPPAKKAGRPTSLTKELGTEVCDRLVRIGSLRTVCDADDMPNKSSVFRWLLKAELEDADSLHTGFRDQYVRARELAKDFSFDELQHDLAKIVKTPLEIDGVPLFIDGKVVETVTPTSVQHARLYLDAYKWQASKENPKKYGEKVQQDITSGGKPIKNEWHLHPVTSDKNGK